MLIETFLHTSRGTLLYAILALALLAVCVFGLGGALSRPKGSTRRTARPSRTNAQGEPVLIDPDGRAAGSPKRPPRSLR